MASLSNKNMMRDNISQEERMISILDSDEPLEDDDPAKRDGGLNPSRKSSIGQIQNWIQLRQTGAVSDKAWSRLIKRNPKSAVLLSAIGPSPEIEQQRITRELSGQYVNPGSQEIGSPGTGGSGLYDEPPTDPSQDFQEAVPARRDYQGLQDALTSRGMFKQADEVMKLGGLNSTQGKGLYGGIQYAFDPRTKQYVPYSVDELTRQSVPINVPQGTQATVPMSPQIVQGAVERPVPGDCQMNVRETPPRLQQVYHPLLFGQTSDEQRT